MLPYGRDRIPPTKGLSYEMSVDEQGIVISVVPLADIGRENKRGVLKFRVPSGVLSSVEWTGICVDVDEGSGRVLLNCHDGDTGEVGLFIAELV